MKSQAGRHIGLFASTAVVTLGLAVAPLRASAADAANSDSNVNHAIDAGKDPRDARLPARNQSQVDRVGSASSSSAPRAYQSTMVGRSPATYPLWGRPPAGAPDVYEPVRSVPQR